MFNKCNYYIYKSKQTILNSKVYGELLTKIKMSTL